MLVVEAQIQGIHSNGFDCSQRRCKPDFKKEAKKQNNKYDENYFM